MGWRKRGRSYDSSSGAGTAIGLKTGKVMSYATRNTMCRVCQEAEKNSREPGAHDCRRNHQGSSKSMEANVAVQLFSEAVPMNVSYSTYVGDDDSSTECRLKTLVNYDIEKWSDINHVCRTLGSRLYAAKSKVKGLTATVITYVQKCFSYCIKQNTGNPTSLLEGLSLIVPHAFGEHEGCRDWCKYKEDPENYRHSDLSGGRDLKGEDLRAALKDALLPFSNEEAAKKMAPGGSSQRNECLNSIIGSKAPKIRNYGASESSDFRTAAGVAQFNEGYYYVDQAAEIMGLASNKATSNYIEKLETKRANDGLRKSNRNFKKTRRTLRKRKSQKTHSLEKFEGVTYESGIALTNTISDITNGTLNDLIKTSLTREEFSTYNVDLKDGGKLEHDETSHQQQSYIFLMFDTETTGLDRQAEILQISCMSSDSNHSFSQYIFPEKRVIAESATNIHGLSVQYGNGKKLVVKDGKHQLSAISQEQGLTEFCNFIRTQDESVVLVAHNGNPFDFPILFNSMERHNLLDLFIGCNIMLVDSLNVISKEMKHANSPLKSCPNKTLSGLYEFLFNEQFNAHDAQDDVAALARILFRSPLTLSVEELISSATTGEEFTRQMELEVERKSRTSTLQRLPVSNGMKEKLGRAGLDLRKMEDVYTKSGTRALLTVLALPVDFDRRQNKSSKPRVTKNLKVLTKIVNFFSRR